MRIQLDLPTEKIKAFCRKWRIVELSLFGSVLRDDFRPDSDVDFLASFAPEAEGSLFDLLDMEAELSDIVGRRVDLVSRSAVEQSRNWVRKKAILGSLEPFYAEG